MRLSRILRAAAIVWLLTLCCHLLTAQSVVRFKTALGAIDVELFDKEKPATVANFLNYVTNGYYTNMFFHRWEPGFVIQGGGFSVARRGTTNAAFSLVRNLGNVTNEYAVGKKYSNTYGTIAMAKLGGDPNSASSQWFFNLADNAANLDNQNGGFTVFGRVLTGTNVLNRFNTPTTDNGIFTLDLTSVTSAFTAVPVLSNRPTFEDLVYADITVLSQVSTPVITTQPTAQQTLLGSSASFSAAASGSGTLTYQWLLNGVAIPNATNATYQVTSATSASVGSYSVVVSNSAGAITSQSAALTLAVKLDVKINGQGSVIRQPDAATYPLGTTVALVATPSAGSRFVRWDGAGGEQSAQGISLVLQDNTSVVAVFEALPLDPFPIIITSKGPLTFEFSVAGLAGGIYEFEYSRDLKTWTPWLKATNHSTGLRIVDPRGVVAPSLFYRGRLTGYTTP